MKNIKAIAFDLGGVLIRENDFVLSEIEQTLEKEFGNINSDVAYYERAINQTNLSKDKIRKHIIHIVENIYELREPDIFENLPKLKFAIASNHVSEMIKGIESIGIETKFNSILFSGNIGSEKPQRAFYEKLITELKEKPENILFIDDSLKNIEGAKETGLSVLHYDRSKSLTQEIINFLNKE